MTSTLSSRQSRTDSGARLVWAGSFASLYGFPLFVVQNLAGVVYMLRTPRIGCEKAAFRPGF